MFLQNKAKVAALAKKIVTAGIETVTQDKLIALLQEDELLKDIQTFDRRMTSFTDFVKGIINGGFTGLDNKKLSSLIADELAPVFFHPEFYNSLSTLVAFLNEEDCTVLLQAMGKSEPKKHAATIMQFLNSVKARDKEALLKSDAFHDADSIKATVELLGQLIEEVIDCQCYYNQHDTKGEQGRGTYPKLHDKLSAELREIRVDADYSFLSGFSRKVFFIQAIRNGLPRCAAVNGDSNQSQVKHLERVKTHILRPLWWSTNMSNVGYALVKTGRNVTLALRASGFAILNAFKTVLNFVRAGKFTISARNPISADYNETAFAMAKTINELTPFDAPKVAVKECLIDTVTGFENCIAARRSPQFFPPVAPVNEEKPCGGIQPQAQ